MKRVLILMLAVMFLMNGVCFAQGDTHAKVIYTYPISNNSGIGIATVIPAGSIRAGVDKVIGYSVQNLNDTGGENIIGVYDSTSIVAPGENMGESEAAQSETATEWYPYPRDIVNGVVVAQGPYTLATIFFIRE